MMDLVAAVLIVLHTVDGHEVTIAPSQVTSLHAAKENTPNKFYVESVNCIVGTTDGKVITVAEKCSVVRQKLEDAK
jgi:hypothetical protein